MSKILYFVVITFLILFGVNFWISFNLGKKGDVNLQGLLKENEKIKKQNEKLKQILKNASEKNKEFTKKLKEVIPSLKGNINLVEPSKEEKPKEVICPKCEKEEPSSTEMNIFETQEEYWSNYGRDEHYTSCDGDFGFRLIEKWRNLKQDLTITNRNQLPQTKIFCHRIHQTRHTGEDNFCHFENLYFFPGNQIGGNSKIRGDAGTFQLELRQSMLSWRSVDHQCKKTLPGVTLLVFRDDAFNVFHSLANILNSFLSLLILNIKPKVDRVVILDTLQDGPYFSSWKAFSDNVIRLNEEVCFEKAVYSIPGGSNFIWKDVWVPNNCYHSSVLKSYIRFMLKHYNLLEQKRREKESPIRITFSVRKFKPGATPGRRIMNEDELVNILKNEIKTPTRKPVPTNIVVIDFGTIPFEKQIELMRNTDIYIGMHGAGMTHLIYLPDEAVVIELFPKGWHQSSMRNLAKYTNKIYLGWQNVHDSNVRDGHSAVIDPKEFTTLVNNAAQIVQSFHLGKGFIE